MKVLVVGATGSIGPGWFDYNKPDEHRLVLLQGDRRRGQRLERRSHLGDDIWAAAFKTFLDRSRTPGFGFSHHMIAAAMLTLAVAQGDFS
jgi:hypothetical protein